MPLAASLGINRFGDTFKVLCRILVFIVVKCAYSGKDSIAVVVKGIFPLQLEEFVGYIDVTTIDVND